MSIRILAACLVLAGAAVPALATDVDAYGRSTARPSQQDTAPTAPGLPHYATPGSYLAVPTTPSAPAQRQGNSDRSWFRPGPTQHETTVPPPAQP